MVTHEEMDVKCVCGNDLFHMKEGWDAFNFFSYKIGVLKTDIRCSKCGHGTDEPFVTSLVSAKENTDLNTDPTLKEKKCPLCSGETMKAKIILCTEGFFDLTEFIHQLKCANPECPWTLESIARSIHKPEMSKEDLIELIAKKIQAKFTELRKEEMNWHTPEECPNAEPFNNTNGIHIRGPVCDNCHPCIRPWEEMFEADKRLPLLYAEIAVDSF